MNEEQQRIAIAEVCGWKPCDNCNCGYWIPPTETHWRQAIKLPDYLNDLNAMHEAEQMLWRMDWRLRDDFIDHLARIINPIHGYRMQDGIDLLDATAAQRAEAFLRTIDKWTSNQPTE